MKGYVYKARVRELDTGREGYVMTTPTVGASGRVCFGVRFDDGRSQIRNEDTCELVLDSEEAEEAAEIARMEAIFAAFPPESRVRLTHEVWRYPHFIAEKGTTGTVVSTDDATLAVRMDEIIPGAEDWGNEVHWYLQNGDDPTAELEVLQ